MANGGIALGNGEEYVDAGTVNGYWDAMKLLEKRRRAGVSLGVEGPISHASRPASPFDGQVRQAGMIPSISLCRVPFRKVCAQSFE